MSSSIPSSRLTDNQTYLAHHGSELQAFLETVVMVVLKDKPTSSPSIISQELLTRALVEHKKTFKPRHKPLVIVGPSGVGKGTLIKMLQEEFGKQLGFSVSHTTRKPRPGEEHGIHYHFTKRDSMERMIQEGAFIEYAKVHDNIYGTSVQAVERVAVDGKVCLLDIDVQGLQAVSKSHLQPNAVYIAPPSFEELEKRLRGRGTETAEAIATRLKTARDEVAFLEKHLASHKIVNDTLDEAFMRLRQKILDWYPHLKEQ